MLGGAVLASIAIAQQLSEAKKQAGLAAAPVESTVAESAS
jgi:hypothetical protein